MPKYRIAFVESIRGGSPFAVLLRARVLQREWNGAHFVHDASALGGVVIKKMLIEMEMRGITDFSGAGGNKTDMLFSMIVVLSDGRKTEVDSENKVKELNPDFGRLRSFHIPALEEEAGNYQYNPDKGVSDRKLEQDHVMSLGMGLWWLEKKFNKKQALGAFSFNPLAPSFDQVFNHNKSQQLIPVRNIEIPEQRIL